MDVPFRVIGFQLVENERSTGVRVFGVADFPDGSGEGQQAVSLYFNPEYVKYSPCLGDLIFAIKNQRGYVDRIVRVGSSAPLPV